MTKWSELFNNWVRLSEEYLSWEKRCKERFTRYRLRQMEECLDKVEMAHIRMLLF